VPSGYIAVVARRRKQPPVNCIGFHQDPDSAMQGLRIIPGSKSSPYPIVGAFYLRSAGVGCRQRGAGAVCQITTNTTYTPPLPSAVGL